LINEHIFYDFIILTVVDQVSPSVNLSMLPEHEVLEREVPEPELQEPKLPIAVLHELPLLPNNRLLSSVNPPFAANQSGFCNARDLYTITHSLIPCRVQEQEYENGLAN
jgi:hypothetical protein